MGNKFISMVLVACLILLPVQIFAYGGDGDGDGEAATSYSDIGMGPPMEFTPSATDIPESYTNPENTVAGDSEQLTYESPSAELSTVASEWLEKELEKVGKHAVTAGKVAIITVSVIGITATIVALAPATAASAGTVAALGFVGKVCGGTALVLTTTMRAAQSYGKGIDEGKSQDEAASEGLKDGMIKAVQEFAMSFTTVTGVISTLGEIQEVVDQ